MGFVRVPDEPTDPNTRAWLGNDESVDLHDEVAALCERLELEPRRVAELVIEPARVRATFFLVNDEGAKYVDPESNSAALGQRTYRVTT